MDNKVQLEYLELLQNNNNRDWYHAHKEEKDAAVHAFEALIQALIDEISLFDSSVAELEPKKLIFRLNRDMRFSKNLPPYKPVFAAHISSAGRFPIPAGYFIHVEPGNVFIGGGVFATQFPEAAKLVRDYLQNHPEEFLAIIEDRSFADTFTVEGVKLKNVPRGYDKDHQLAEYFKHKSWDLEYHYNDDDFVSVDTCLKDMVHMFELMKPFNDYLNRALVDFTRPVRK